MGEREGVIGLGEGRNRRAGIDLRRFQQVDPAQ
jgi:hypothetical protein